MFKTPVHPTQQLTHQPGVGLPKRLQQAVALSGAQPKQLQHQTAYLAQVNFVCWPPFDYRGHTQPEYQLFSYTQFIRVWPEKRVFVLFHSDSCQLFDGSSLGGFAIPSDCFYWSSCIVGAFQ